MQLPLTQSCRRHGPGAYVSPLLAHPHNPRLVAFVRWMPVTHLPHTDLSHLDGDLPRAGSRVPARSASLMALTVRC
eukprot:365101-Chlamydomonas_euryale.AAC.1